MHPSGAGPKWVHWVHELTEQDFLAVYDVVLDIREAQMEKLFSRNGAVFATLLRTGKRGEIFNPPCFTKWAQEP